MVHRDDILIYILIFLLYICLQKNFSKRIYSLFYKFAWLCKDDNPYELSAVYTKVLWHTKSHFPLVFIKKTTKLFFTDQYIILKDTP